VSSDSTNTVFFAQRVWCTVGAAVAGLAVVIGAFGAHVVQDVLKEVHASADAKEIAGLSVPASYKYFQDFRTAAAYQMTHGVAIFLVGLLGRRGKARIFAYAAAGCFLGGVILFSGSLYLLAMTGLRWLGMVAPVGGALLIAGWGLLAVAAAMPRSTSSERRR
jgi:uncharacterized membrane protein YgdD (TMEM256/DUF423 family)